MASGLLDTRASENIANVKSSVRTVFHEISNKEASRIALQLREGNINTSKVDNSRKQIPLPDHHKENNSKPQHTIHDPTNDHRREEERPSRTLPFDGTEGTKTSNQVGFDNYTDHSIDEDLYWAMMGRYCSPGEDAPQWDGFQLPNEAVVKLLKASTINTPDSDYCHKIQVASNSIAESVADTTWKTPNASHQFADTPESLVDYSKFHSAQKSVLESTMQFNGHHESDLRQGIERKNQIFANGNTPTLVTTTNSYAPMTTLLPSALTSTTTPLSSFVYQATTAHNETQSYLDRIALLEYNLAQHEERSRKEIDIRHELQLRIKTLTTEVRFADQTCLEECAKSQALKEQIEIMLVQNEEMRKELKEATMTQARMLVENENLKIHLQGMTKSVRQSLTSDIYTTEGSSSFKAPSQQINCFEAGDKNILSIGVGHSLLVGEDCCNSLLEGSALDRIHGKYTAKEQQWKQLFREKQSLVEQVNKEKLKAIEETKCANKKESILKQGVAATEQHLRSKICKLEAENIETREKLEETRSELVSSLATLHELNDEVAVFKRDYDLLMNTFLGNKNQPENKYLLTVESKMCNISKNDHEYEQLEDVQYIGTLHRQSRSNVVESELMSAIGVVDREPLAPIAVSSDFANLQFLSHAQSASQPCDRSSTGPSFELKVQSHQASMQKLIDTYSSHLKDMESKYTLICRQYDVRLAKLIRMLQYLHNSLEFEEADVFFENADTLPAAPLMVNKQAEPFQTDWGLHSKAEERSACSDHCIAQPHPSDTSKSFFPKSITMKTSEKVDRNENCVADSAIEMKSNGETFGCRCGHVRCLSHTNTNAMQAEYGSKHADEIQDEMVPARKMKEKLKLELDSITAQIEETRLWIEQASGDSGPILSVLEFLKKEQFSRALLEERVLDFTNQFKRLEADDQFGRSFSALLLDENQRLLLQSSATNKINQKDETNSSATLDHLQSLLSNVAELPSNSLLEQLKEVEVTLEKLEFNFHEVILERNALKELRNDLVVQVEGLQLDLIKKCKGDTEEKEALTKENHSLVVQLAERDESIAQLTATVDNLRNHKSELKLQITRSGQVQFEFEQLNIANTTLEKNMHRLREYAKKLRTKCDAWQKFHDEVTTKYKAMQQHRDELQRNYQQQARSLDAVRSNFTENQNTLLRTRTQLEEELQEIAYELSSISCPIID